MTDPETAALAQATLSFLLPHLDYIRGKLADSVLSETGKSLIMALKNKWFSKSASAKEAVEDAAANPADPDSHQALLITLRKALKSDPTLAEDLARLLPNAGIQLTMLGDSNKTAIAQGDGNKFEIH